MRSAIVTLTLLMISLSLPARGQAPMAIPNDFPHFQVPGHEKEMDTVRSLFWLHYPGSGPKATLWDEWLSSPGLWPAVRTDNYAEKMRQQWSRTLSGRVVDSEGYVATHQHPSIAHQLGWPFPFWHGGQGGYGWHFSFKDTVGPPWRPEHLNKQDGWTLSGAKDQGIGEAGWDLKLTGPHAVVTAPKQPIDSFQSPFIQIRWSGSGLGNAQPYLEWTTKTSPDFAADRRFYFEPTADGVMTYTMIPVYKHPKWTGEIKQMRVNLGNPEPGGSVTIQALFTQYDTRHTINSQNFVRGCARYFWWTHDLNFLRRNINRMRTAMRYVMDEHQTLKRKVVHTDWVGHDGLSGLRFDKDGKKTVVSGHGIGQNYWDILPFGNLDTYATIHYYDALHYMAEIEREIEAHPEWDVAEGMLRLDPDMLTKHAAEVKAEGNRLFWNPKTGRFVACIDVDGKTHDYGYTFLNLEAVFYDFATPEHAKQIMSWISGERTVEGDTSQGVDIYHWRFGPRATTKRNTDWYFWGWSAPESIPFGGQVQDGGAVLGFSYHDLMARLKTRGPDDAWKRLQEIVRWFDEVQAEGGYRKYYDGKKREGSLQGGGTAGGLGLDQEFFESVLIPQIMLDGFLGFAPTADGFKIDPRLPTDWPELRIDRIHWHDLVLNVRTSSSSIEVTKEGQSDEPCFVRLPKGEWKLSYIGGSAEPVTHSGDVAVRVDWQDASGVRMERVGRE